MKKTVYAGTYTGNGSEGIYAFSFEDGILSDPSLFCRIRNPKYVHYEKGVLATVCDTDNGSGCALINEAGEIEDVVAFEKETSCFITRKDDTLYTANYHAGTFSIVDIVDGRLKFNRTVRIQEGAGCHQVILHGDDIMVPSLFLDRVLIDRDGKFSSIRFTQGTGPRHGVVTRDGRYLYLASELSNELFVIDLESGEIKAQMSVLPDGEKHKRDTAAIRLSEDEKYIYVSTRTMDIISVFEVTDHQPKLIQVVSCLGRHPRDFIILDGYLLCANRYSNTVVSMKINEDGTIGRLVSKITVPQSVSLAVRQ